MMEIRIVDLLLTILNFFILMGLLYLVLYRPVLNLLSAREAKIKRENEELARLRKEAEELKSHWEAKNQELACERRRILEEARQQGLKEKEELIRQAREDALQIIARARLEVQRERNRLWEELWEEIVGIIITIATKVVGEEFNEEKQREKVRAFIKNLDAKAIGELTNEAH